MTVFFNKERQKWSYDFQYSGERYQGYCVHPKEKTLARNKTEARKIEEIIKGNVKKSDIPQKELVAANTTEFTLAEAFAYYLKRKKGDSDFQNVKTRVLELLDFFGHSTSMRSLTESEVERYKDFAKLQPAKKYIGKDEDGNPKYKDQPHMRSARTINDYLQIIPRAYRWFRRSLEEELRPYVPPPPEFDYLKEPKLIAKPIPPDISEAYINEMDTGRNRHTILGYILCIQTGLRECEATGIREHQYKEAQRKIVLEAHQTKTKAERDIMVNEIAHKAIMECRKVGDILWAMLQSDPALAKRYEKEYGIRERGDIPLILYRPNKTGKPRPVKRLATSAWKKHRKAVGEHYRWHDTRAAFCSGTENIMAAKDLAGHANVETTQGYVKAQERTLRRAANNVAEAHPINIPMESLTEVPNTGKRRKRHAQ